MFTTSRRCYSRAYYGGTEESLLNECGSLRDDANLLELFVTIDQF